MSAAKRNVSYPLPLRVSCPLYEELERQLSMAPASSFVSWSHPPIK